MTVCYRGVRVQKARKTVKKINSNLVYRGINHVK
mgnify:FL=1